MRNGVTIVDPATTRIDADGRDRPGRADRAVDGPGGRDGHRARTRSSARTRRCATAASVRAPRSGPAWSRRRASPRTWRSARSSHLRPGARGRAALPDRQLRRDQEEPARRRDAAAPLQLPRRRRGRRGRERRCRVGDRQLRRAPRSTAPSIGDRASIGVDTMLVAPVTIGEGATTGAGGGRHARRAPGKTVVGMPARPIELDAGRETADGRPSRVGRIGTRREAGSDTARWTVAVPPATRSMSDLAGCRHPHPGRRLLRRERDRPHHRQAASAQPARRRGQPSPRAPPGAWSRTRAASWPPSRSRSPSSASSPAPSARPPSRGHRRADRRHSPPGPSADAADTIAFVIVTLRHRAGLDHRRRAGAEDAGAELPRALRAVRGAPDRLPPERSSRRSSGSSRASARSSSACSAARRGRRAATCRPRS